MDLTNIGGEQVEQKEWTCPFYLTTFKNKSWWFKVHFKYWRHKNIGEGKESGIDRTKRLFYVACGRAQESLAIIAYTNNPEKVKDNVLQYGWFVKEELEIITE